MLATSVPLFRLDADDLPTNHASGTFIDYRGRRFLLSVQHAIRRGDRGWAIFLGNEAGDGAAVFRLHDLAYVAEKIQGSGHTNHIDLCFTEVPTDLVSTYQNTTPRGTTDERPRHIFVTDLSNAPDPNGVFAFAGQVNSELHGNAAFVSDMTVFPGLKYLRTEAEYHVFQLPVPHPGHKEFKGCSGAPIVDMKRSVVAVVCDGDVSTNTVRGVSLARYKFAFDFMLDHVTGG